MLIFGLSRSQNVLHVFASNGKPFRLVVDSLPVNENPQSHVKTGLLFKDTIKVVLLFNDQTRYEAELLLLVKRKPVKNKEFTFAVEPYKYGFRPRFISCNNLTKLPDPLVPPKPIEDTTWKVNNNIWEHYCELKDGKPLFFNNLDNGKVAMPDSYLAYAKRLITRCQVEDDKFKIVAQTILKNYLNSKQLQMLLSGISFELDKLKLIRLAGNHVTDPQNLKSLRVLFTYESSQRELDQIISQSKENSVTPKDCPKASEDTVIALLVQQLKGLDTDKARVDLIRTKSSEYCYTIEQTKKILAAFIHDRERLDASKQMYYTCTERSNFKQLKEAFIYSETVNELNRFLEQFEK